MDIICRVAQGNFNVIWQPGKSNLADFFTKAHPVHHHLAMRRFFVQTNDVPRRLNDVYLQKATTATIPADIQTTPPSAYSAAVAAVKPVFRGCVEAMKPPEQPAQPPERNVFQSKENYFKILLFA